MVYRLKTAPGLGKAGSSTVDTPAVVKGVIDDIRAAGDGAVRKYSEKFDKWAPQSFKLSGKQIEAEIAKVPQQTIEDIKEAQGNIRTFALAQRKSSSDFEIETQLGVYLGQKNIPIRSVGM